MILDMGEGSKAPLILGRPFLKTARANIDVGKGEIKFDINGTTSEFKFHPRLEVCNMINVKYVPPHRRITEEKPKKEEEPNKKEAKKEIEVVASIATKKIVAPVKKKAKSPPVETKKTIEASLALGISIVSGRGPSPEIQRFSGPLYCLLLQLNKTGVNTKWEESKATMNK